MVWNTTGRSGHTMSSLTIPLLWILFNRILIQQKVAQPFFRDQRLALAYLSMSRARHMTCCWSPLHRTQFSLGYGLICQKTFFSSIEKKAPNRLQKRVRNGSPSVPLLSLKARFWRFYFSFFRSAKILVSKDQVYLAMSTPRFTSRKNQLSRGRRSSTSLI